MDFSSAKIEAKTRELVRILGVVTTAEGKITYDEARCRVLAPIILEIEALKRERNAMILAHTYLTSVIQKTVADVTGDSFGLSVEAQRAEADVIVFAAVDFMAETAKILNPGKVVLAPNSRGGCSLADSITGAEVRALRAAHPDYTFLCYINTTAEVKAACDITVTSSNVYGIAEVVENDKIFFVPDRLMAVNVQRHLDRRGVNKELRFSEGSCYVHEQYTPEEIVEVRRTFSDVEVLAHPECRPEVIDRADYVGSTAQMLRYVEASRNERFLVLTECGLVDKLRDSHPDKRFVGVCHLCENMKANTLEDILAVLREPTRGLVELDPEVSRAAKRSLDAMFTYTEKARVAGLLE